MQDSYRAGLTWLAHSGIQAESGGLSRYYRGDSGEYKNISTEITAFGILAYLYLPLPGHTGLLSNALRAGQFLCYDASDSQTDLFPFEVAAPGVLPDRYAYFFDCGVVIRGLIALWHATGDPMYLERAEMCGASMMDRMSRVDGSFFPIYNLDTLVPSVGSDNWSLEPGVYQLKAGVALWELAELTSSGLFSKTAEKLLKFCLRQHEVFLPGHSEPDRIADRLHAYCYFLEGLLPFVEKRFDCSLILQSGMARVERLLAETRPALERCDVAAQLLRLRLLGDYMGIIEMDVGTAAREAENIQSLQLHTGDRRTNGAFAFGRRDGQIVCHANPVATIFALQALRMWNEHQGGALRTTWPDLI
ncbi:MAG TPA: hypothetical protein VEU62_04120 [Bryobacterales bacterium]|nr:hypothetical protein [Bryobacterales bacterium]